MQCPRCRHESLAGARFCEECGGALSPACPACRTLNSPGSFYCRDCGAALGTATGPEATPDPHEYTPRYLAERIIRAREALEGERKQVTVLFADLRGSLEILADRDPEDARRLLDPVLERMMEAVHRYEGTVNQVMGDGIMALFGAPLAHEDHAVRACYAALRMQDSIASLSEELRQRHGLSVQIRVGLNSGEVVVRSVGSDLRMDYTAVGQTTHLAGRMEQLAAPGQIFLTEYTLQLAEGYVVAKSLGPVPVKGLAAPVAIFELKGPGPIRSRLQLAAARGLSRFVGRDVELADLSAAMEQAGAGHGQIVALVGEPGVGKSRLVREFTTGHLPAEWRVLEAFATSFDTRAPYLPMISLLRGYFDLQEWDDARAIREKVTAALLDLDQSLLGALPALLTLLDVPVEDPAWQGLDPRQRRRRTLDAIRRLLIRESHRRPLCLVVEDLHWIDPEAQAVLDALVESLPAARILLLVTYRPEYRQGWSQKSYYAQIAVHSLQQGMAEELLRGLLGDGADVAKLRAQLIERTEGNPFFLEESIRHLVGTGALSGERGAYRLARAADTVEVPATVQALLAARIDRLAPEDKRVLQCAAVIGKDVPFPLLEAIADVSEDELRRSVHHLQAAEFLYEASIFPVFEYTFKHGLTLDVTLRSLLQDRRRDLDARLVAALESIAGERTAEQVERLAHHAFRGGVWDKAVTYGREAGARAFARSAHRTDVHYFEQALQALEHLPKNPDTLARGIDLRLELRAALAPIGEYSRMLEVLTEAEGLARTLGDQRRLGLILSFLTNFFALRGDFERAITHGEDARRIAAALGDPTLQAPAAALLSLACFYGPGDYAKAIALGEETRRLLTGDLEHDRFGMAFPPSVYSRTVMAWSLAEQGEFAHGLAVGHEGLRIAEGLNHPHSEVFALLGIGMLHLKRGDFAEAIQTLERGKAICETADLPPVLLEVALPLGSAYAQSGRANDAVALLDRAVSQAIALKSRLGHWLRSGGMAEAYLAAGRAKEALPLAELFLDITGMMNARGVQAWARHLLAAVAVSVGPEVFDRSERELGAALAAADSLGMRPLAARCHLTLGELYLRMGGRQQAASGFSAAVEICRAADMPYWLARAEQGLNEASRPRNPGS
jgi:class 3 adenylate cyclase/tetratricopeptide (TPR) repeat protein